MRSERIGMSVATGCSHGEVEQAVTSNRPISGSLLCAGRRDHVNLNRRWKTARDGSFAVS